MRLPIAVVALSLIAQMSLACSYQSSTSIDAVHQTLAARQVAPPVRTVIRNVHIFDGTSMTGPGTVVMENGLISHVGSCVQTRADVEVDGTGKFLIPGLVDSHIHIDSVAQLELVTSFGVTTAINMNCNDYPLCAALADVSGLASMITATRGVTTPGSPHALIFNRPPDQLLQPDDDVAAFVARLFAPDSPAAFLKMSAEPGGPSQAQLDALVAAAHYLGHPATTHASYVSAVVQAVASRTDGIQHIAMDGSLPPSLIEQIRANGQFVTPTLAIFRVATNDPVLARLLSPGNSPNASLNFAVPSGNVRALHEAGVPILAGTDSATLAGYSMPFGLALHCELQYLVDAGHSASEALRSATILPARIHDLGNRGVIRRGMRADLVLLDENPLVNISNTRKVARVWAGGIEYGPVARDLTQSCSGLKLAGH